MSNTAYIKQTPRNKLSGLLTRYTQVSRIKFRVAHTNVKENVRTGLMYEMVTQSNGHITMQKRKGTARNNLKAMLKSSAEAVGAH